MGRYLMVLPVPAYRSGPDTFEIESAFAQHLRTLRTLLGPLADSMVVCSPELSAVQRAGLVLDTVRADEGIVFRALCPAGISGPAYYRRLPAILRVLREEIARADVVHAGTDGLHRPIGFPALLIAQRLGKKTISVTDIDHRNDAKMNYLTGRWSLREYLTTRVLHDTNNHLQHLYAVRNFSLVLLKSARLCADYGRGRDNVKNFLDSAFETRHLIAPERLEQKTRAVLDRNAPLEVIYFGRLTSYKGVDHMLYAVRHALDGGANLRFRVVGAGEDRAALERLSQELGLQAHVAFVGAVPFGAPLFEILYDAQLLLAAPLSEDTPRSALDALAAGELLLSYATRYYEDLADRGAPIELVPWRDHAAMGERLIELERDRERVARGLRSAHAFAEPNTQEAWLERRVAWTKALFSPDATVND